MIVKKMLLIVVLYCLIMLTCSGCCTMMSGRTQEISINSTPTGATVTADNGTSIITPGKITLDKYDEHILTAEYPGYKQQQQKLEKKLNNWVWGNILIGGIIGLIIDNATGSINELQPKEVHFNFDQHMGNTSRNIPNLQKYMLFERYKYHKYLKIYKTAA